MFVYYVSHFLEHPWLRAERHIFCILHIWHSFCMLSRDLGDVFRIWTLLLIWTLRLPQSVSGKVNVWLAASVFLQQGALIHSSLSLSTDCPCVCHVHVYMCGVESPMLPYLCDSWLLSVCHALKCERYSLPAVSSPCCRQCACALLRVVCSVCHHDWPHFCWQLFK